MIWMCLFPSAKVKCSLALRWEAQITPPNSKKPIWTFGHNLTHFQDTSMPFYWYYSHLNNLCEGKGARNWWAKQCEESWGYSFQSDILLTWVTQTSSPSLLYQSMVRWQCRLWTLSLPLNLSTTVYWFLSFHDLLFIISLFKIKSKRNVISVWRIVWT